MAAKKVRSQSKNARGKAVRKASRKARPAGRKRPAVRARRRAATARKASPIKRTKRKAARRPKPAARKATSRSARKTSKKAKKATRRSAAKRAPKPAPKRAPGKRPATPARKAPGKRSGPPVKAKTASRVRRSTAPATPKPPIRSARANKPAAVRHLTPPTLDRERRRLAEVDEDTAPATQDSGDIGRLIASAQTGAEELREMLRNHTESSPALAGGDIDARWADAYAVGDEAPGGDNPTPDQDRVEDIGRALGVTYEDREELQGSDKIAERDKHRWELDPASSDDWPHNAD